MIFVDVTEAGHARTSDVCASSDIVCILRIGKPTDVAAQSTAAKTPVDQNIGFFVKYGCVYI